MSQLDPGPDNESVSYQVMLGEVESIVKQIAEPNVDLDQMLSKIGRGYELIKAMRKRLEHTKMQVEQLRLTME